MGLRNDHDGAGCQTRQLLRDAAEEQAGQTAASPAANDEQVSLSATHHIDYRFRRIAPSGLKFDGSNADTKRALSGLSENLIRRRLERLAEIAIDVRQVPELRSGNASANRQDRQIGADNRRERCGCIDRTSCPRRAIGRDSDALHCACPMRCLLSSNESEVSGIVKD